jgi:anti-sigma B factor antagonist
MDTPFAVSSVGDYTVVTFQSPSLMNPSELERLSTALHSLIDDHVTGRLLLDFSKVEYLSSQAIGIIVGLHKKASKITGGKLVLCGVGPQLMQLLKITRLDRLLKVIKNQEELAK